MNQTPVRLLLVDDQPYVRLGLNALFSTVPHFQVVGEASTAAEAIATARKSHPDVVIMDLRLPDGDGAAVCKRIRTERPTTHVIMLSSCSSDVDVVKCLKAGAQGYVLKVSKPERLIEGVEIVARDGSLLDPDVTRAVVDFWHATDPLNELNDREQRILDLIVDGKTNKEIAALLTLSRHTVKWHVSNIYGKLNVHRRSEAAALGARRRSSLGAI